MIKYFDTSYPYIFSGNVYGPYGGNGGVHFEAKPPESYNKEGKKIHCYLGWISGQSDQRLDAISFHWKCPKEPSSIHPQEKKEHIIGSQIPHSFKIDTSAASNIYLNCKVICQLLVPLTYILVIHNYLSSYALAIIFRRTLS